MAVADSCRCSAVPELEDVSLDEEEVALDEEVSLSSLLELSLLDDEEELDEEVDAAFFAFFFCFFSWGSSVEACSLGSSSDGAMKRGRFCTVPGPRSSSSQNATELLQMVKTS